MSSSSTREGKKTKGRQKINMQKIENKPYCHVTFSKRRKGCFKKAYELSILTGAEVAAIIFSPGGKIYSYGHPTVEEVVERFYPTIERTFQPPTLIEERSRQIRDEKIARTNAELVKVQETLTSERERGIKLDKELAESEIQDWEANDPQKQTKEQLQQSILELKNICGLFEREINSRKIPRYQEYEALDVGHNYYGGEGGMPLQLRVNNVYDGSSLQGLIAPIAYAGGQESVASGTGGGIFPFMMGPGGSGVGYSNVVADPAGLGPDMIGSSGFGNIVSGSDDGFSSGVVSMPPNWVDGKF